MRISDWSSDVCSSDLFLQRLAVFLGVRRIDLRTATHGIDRLVEQLLARTRGAQRLANGTLVFSCGKHEQFGRNELVFLLLREFVGQVDRKSTRLNSSH